MSKFSIFSDIYQYMDILVLFDVPDVRLRISMFEIPIQMVLFGECHYHGMKYDLVLPNY